MHLGVRDWQLGNLNVKPTLCVGWLYFKDELSLETVRTEVMSKIVKKVLRYRALPVERDGWTHWDEIPVESMDLEYHFGTTTDDSFETENQWRAHLDAIVEKGLDYAKPWWKYQLIKKLPCGRSGLLMITDHAFGDGASGVSALLSICQKNIIESPRKKKTQLAAPRKLTMYENLFAIGGGISKPLLEAVLPNDRPTKLKSIGFPQSWDYSLTSPTDFMDVNLFKDIKDKIPGCTVNDVMLALTALSIRNYYKDIKEPIMNTKKDITATYAVNTRPLGVNYLGDEWFGNHVVAATTPYPLHDSRIKTLLKFRDNGRMRKNSPDTLIRVGIAEFAARMVVPFVDRLPFVTRSQALKTGAETQLKFSVMISNVVFSMDKLSVFGQEIDDVQFLAMTPLGCYCGVSTYAGKVNCNVVTAKNVEANPSAIAAYYKKELYALHDEVMALKQSELIVLDAPEIASLYSLLLSFFYLFFGAFLR